MILKMKREGTFHANFRETAVNCGRGGQTIFQYRVEVECDEDVLDSRGFIMDNNDVQFYFDSTYRRKQDAVSCENIAMKACIELHRMIVKRESVRRLAVTINGSAAAGLTAEWDRSMGAIPKEEENEHEATVRAFRRALDFA